MAAADSEPGDVGDDVAGSFFCLPPLLGAESTNRLRGVLTRPATERNVGDTGLVAVDDVESGESGAGAVTGASADGAASCADACTDTGTDSDSGSDSGASLMVVPVLLLPSSLLLLVLLLLLSATPLPGASACAGAGAASASAPASAASASPGMASKREEGKPPEEVRPRIS